MSLPDPNTKVRYRSNTVYGGAVYVGRRVAMHLDVTREASLKKWNTDVSIMQGSFNTTVAASAGTHDYDRVIDCYLSGVDWWAQQKFFREQGWAAWYRYPPSFTPHIHMISLGGNSRVGIYVPGQISDYYAHRSGLAGHYSDNSWHPSSISATIFDYAKYLNQEDDVLTKAEHEALMRIDRALKKSATVGSKQASADKARDNNLSKAVARGFDDLVESLKEESKGVKEKVTISKERIVSAIRAIEEDDTAEPEIA